MRKWLGAVFWVIFATQGARKLWLMLAFLWGAAESGYWLPWALVAVVVWWCWRYNERNFDNEGY